MENVKATPVQIVTSGIGNGTGFRAAPSQPTVGPACSRRASFVFYSVFVGAGRVTLFLVVVRRAAGS
jgi:hypothetical protein